MSRFKKWQKLNHYFEQGVLAFVDLAFAESLLYRAQEGFVNSGLCETKSNRSEAFRMRSPSLNGKGYEENRFGEVAASPNSKRLGSDEQGHAALLAVLFALSRQGHLTLDLSKEALDSTLRLLGVNDTESLAELLHAGAETFPWWKDGGICRFGTYYYLQKNWIYESEILKHLKRLNQHSPTIPLSFSTIDETRLNEAQRKGVENAMTHSLSLLTGGPGTGKTFTAAHLVKACLHSLPEDKRRQMRIILTAPTGKAVAQLEGNLRNLISGEVSIRAGTLHAILGIKPYQDEEEKMTILFADLIIVDECSMIDAKIFSQLLASVPTGARLILIGDKDQLPPIEAGSIFADLLDADVFPSAHLTESLRSDRSEILKLSHHIKQGNTTAALECLEGNSEIVWVDLKENKKTLLNLWEKYQGHFITYEIERPQPEQILTKMGQFTLLSSMRQGALGVDEVNRYFLYQSLQQIPQNAWWIAPIMITRNDYPLELYNGDLGFLVRRVTSDFSLRQFNLDDYALFHDRKGGRFRYKQIAALNLTSFEYSYCLSVHKSQGSEYDETVILVPPGSESFGREVLYTAVTRARNKISLMCSKDLFTEALAISSRKTSGLRMQLSSATKVA